MTNFCVLTALSWWVARQTTATQKDANSDSADGGGVVNDGSSVVATVSASGILAAVSLGTSHQTSCDPADVRAWVDREVVGSLARVRIDRLAGPLLHRPADLLDRVLCLYDALIRLKSIGLVEKIWVSIYHTTEFDSVAYAMCV